MRPHHLSLLFLLSLTLLTACGGNEPNLPSRPGEDNGSAGDAAFTAVAARVESVTEGRSEDTYSITMADAATGTLAATLTAAKMTAPFGTHPAAGAVVTLPGSRPFQATGGEITLTAQPDGRCALSGTLTAGARTVKADGAFALDIQPPTLAVTLDHLESATATPQGLNVTLRNSDAWELRLTIAGAADIWSIGPEATASEATLRDLADGVDYPIAGAIAISSNMGVLAGSFNSPLLRVSIGAWIGTPEPGPDPEPDPEPQLPSDAVVLEKLLHAERTAPGTVRLYLGDESAGLAYDPKQWQVTYSGTGRVLVAELHTIDGELPAGVYPASAAAAPGTFRMGYDPGDIHGIGIYLRDWGTCALTVTDGRAEASHVTDGAIIITAESLTLVSTAITAVYPTAIQLPK